MVKNKILHEANVVADQAKKSSDETDPLWDFGTDWWSQDVGRGLQRRPRIDMCLNHWLTLRNESETKSYDEFKVFEKYAETEKGEGRNICDIAQDFRTIGQIYERVEKEEITQEGIAQFLARRNVMNMGVVTPLLLWLLSSKVPEESLLGCLKALESFLVRRVVCGLSARSYGEIFVGAIARLADQRPDNIHQALARLRLRPTRHGQSAAHRLLRP